MLQNNVLGLLAFTQWPDTKKKKKRKEEDQELLIITGYVDQRKNKQLDALHQEEYLLIFF
jgi:hypothetical protein